MMRVELAENIFTLQDFVSAAFLEIRALSQANSESSYNGPPRHTLMLVPKHKMGENRRPELELYATWLLTSNCELNPGLTGKGYE